MKTLSYALAFTAGLLIATTAHAGSLENLERERAITVKTMLQPDLDIAQRHAKLESQQRRLVDLERMVIRDKSLRGQTNKTVKIAFKNYDVTFLAHASGEKGTTLTDHWLTQFGITTDALLSARTGRR